MIAMVYMSGVNPSADLRSKFQAAWPHLDERARRIMAASEGKGPLVPDPRCQGSQVSGMGGPRGDFTVTFEHEFLEEIKVFE